MRDIDRTDRRVTAELFAAERRGNTTNGNPRYRFTTDAGTFDLQSDAGYGYEVTNHKFPRVAVLVLTRANRVRWIEELPAVPDDFPVRPLAPGEPAKDRVTCGTCHRSWDDAIPTQWTPTPSARCPFEYFH